MRPLSRCGVLLRLWVQCASATSVFSFSQALLSAGAAISPCTDSYRFCPSNGQTFPVMPVSAGTACWKNTLVFANDARCAPCAAGSLVPVYVAVSNAEGGAAVPAAPAFYAAESSSAGSGAAGANLLGGVIGAAVGAAVIAIAAAVVVLRRRRTRRSVTLASSASGVASLGMVAEDSVAHPSADVSPLNSV